MPKALGGYSRAMKGRRVRHAEAARVVLAACSAAGALAVCRVAAAESGDQVRIVWDAPPGCPDREVIVRRVSDALADAPPGLGAGWRVHGRVQAGGASGWVLALQLRSPHTGDGAPPAERVLSARDCDDLGEAAAVAIAIALDDASKEGEGEATTPGAAAVAPTRVEHEPSAAAPAAALDAALDSGGTSVVSGRPHEPVRLAFAADGVLDSASLGGLGWGASVELSGWWRRFGVGGYGVWLAPR